MAFDERAPTYESGWHGEIHHRIACRSAEIALAREPAPQRILDVGCGTGFLLRHLADQLHDAVEFVGIDPAPSMVETARSLASDDNRIGFVSGVAEKLPFPDEAFDLVVSTTSFDHWHDQQLGLRECARVLKLDHDLVLTDLFSLLLIPTLLLGRRGRARTKGRVNGLLSEAGFRSPTWHANTYQIIQTVVARRDVKLPSPDR